MEFESWGRYPKVTQQALPIAWRTDSFPEVPQHKTVLPFGMGRSYGDSCLNESQCIIPIRALNHFIAFDQDQGYLTCEAGVSFEEVLNLVVPAGWFVPVTPGTKYITVAGAVANDIHGKNHHCEGSFGHYVLEFELLRSDGSRTLCSLKNNTDLFKATIGGLGLTGLLTWVTFKLKSIKTPFIDQEIIRFANLSAFFKLSKESEPHYNYIVSWIDCLAKDENLGRGLFIRGNHAEKATKKFKKQRQTTFPIDAPSFLLNSLSIKVFNALYYHKNVKSSQKSVVSYDPFFYPLDSIESWNKMYGKRGFLQYQCVVPYKDGDHFIRKILEEIARNKMGSFLAVLKTFGTRPAAGLLSFPREGVTLALDFPNSGQKVFKLLDRLDQIVCEAQGAVYPAKDARMSQTSFKSFFPRWQEFSKFKDAKFSSSFWRRVS